MKKFSEFKGYILVILYVGGLVSLDLLLKIMVDYSLYAPRAILFSMSFAAIFAAIGLMFKGIGRLVFYGLTGSLFSILALGQVIYYRFYKGFFSVNQMTNLGELGTVKGEILRVLEVKYLLFFVPVALIILCGILLKKFQTRHKFDFYGIILLVIGAALLSSFTKSTFNVAESDVDRYKDDQYLFNTLFDKEKSMNRFGLYQYTLQDIKLTVSRNLEKTQTTGAQTSMIDDYFEKLDHTHESNEMTGLFEGKNVVYVMAESLFDRAIDPNVTPTLSKFISEGIYFDNYYSPTYKGSTSDTEFIANTSLVPSVNYGNTSYDFSQNYFPNSLANNFRDAGYKAQSFHSNTGDFYNRFNYHEALGYEEFYDQKALGLNFLPEWQYMINWPSDTDLIDAAADVFLENDQFFSYIITTNGHTPYTTERTELLDNYNYVKPFIDSEDDEIVYYYAAQNAFDQSMEQLVNRLEEANELDDTVIIIFGDHYPYPIHHEKLWAYDSTDEWNWQEFHKVPLIMWTPGAEQQTVSKLMSSFDLAPTVANLFNLDYDYYHAFGVDAFSEKESSVIFANYGWISEHARNNKWSDYYESYDEIGTEAYMQAKDSEVIEMFDIGQKVLKDNYFLK
ncbi:MAG: LTA synthase family protein [Turicibacter sp.]